MGADQHSESKCLPENHKGEKKVGRGVPAEPRASDKETGMTADKKRCAREFTRMVTNYREGNVWQRLLCPA